jgi:segregation and condensation protein A
LDYIKAMRRLDLEIAGEFVSMAATLLHIKSRMLLPQHDGASVELEREEEADPRRDLALRLLEYQKFKDLSASLNKLTLLGRDVLARGEVPDVSESSDSGELLLEENPLYSLISAFRAAMKNFKKGVHRVMGDLQSIASRIFELKELLIVGSRRRMADLITETQNPGNQILVTFLSLLELAKMGFISLFQSDPMADIYVEAQREIDRDVVSRIENYDSVNAEATATRIFAEENATAESADEEGSRDSVADDAPTAGGQEQDREAEMNPEVVAATDAEIEAELARLDRMENGQTETE